MKNKKIKKFYERRSTLNILRLGTAALGARFACGHGLSSNGPGHKNSHRLFRATQKLVDPGDRSTTDGKFFLSSPTGLPSLRVLPRQRAETVTQH